MKKYLCLALLAIFLILPIASAENIGISPAKISFEKMMRGGYAKNSISVVVDTEDSLLVEAESTGEIADWINLSHTSFEVSLDSPQSIGVEINVPTDAANGNYTGYVKVKVSSQEQAEEGRISGKVHSNLNLKISVEVTDEEIINCKIYGAKILDSEENEDILLTFEIENNGNTRIKPTIQTDIWDAAQSEILQSNEFTTPEILPTTSQSLNFTIQPENLEEAQYWTDFLVPKCDYSKLLTFDILEAGSLDSKGVLLSFVANPTAKVGEIVKSEIGFKNIGETSIDAKFSGTVSRDGKLIKILETETSTVPRTEIETFDLYFTPEQEGDYLISGRVFYEGKRTAEKSLTITVEKSSLALTNTLYAAFIILIAIVLIKITKEKQKHRRRRR